MQDLDIRGAGNLLGAEQSGFIMDMGYETYQKILEEAMEELEFALEQIRPWNITLPLVFDWEQVLNYGSRTASPNWAAVTDCVVAFCDGAAAAGYQPMAYFNPSMAYLHLDLPRLEQYPKWLAHYVERTTYPYDFQMWQYGSSGSVNGIEGRVDMNIMLSDLHAQ